MRNLLVYFLSFCSFATHAQNGVTKSSNGSQTLRYDLNEDGAIDKITLKPLYSTVMGPYQLTVALAGKPPVSMRMEDQYITLEEWPRGFSIGVDSRTQKETYFFSMSSQSTSPIIEEASVVFFADNDRFVDCGWTFMDRDKVSVKWLYTNSTGVTLTCDEKSFTTGQISSPALAQFDSWRDKFFEKLEPYRESECEIK
jgi:hypothetical protein